MISQKNYPKPVELGRKINVDFYSCAVGSRFLSFQNTNLYSEKLTISNKKLQKRVFVCDLERLMGMPENQHNGMNIAPDGTIYEILDDGTIKRIGKVSPDGSFEPFGGAKEGIREKNGIIYRVVNGKEVKIGRILPNGEIETINQKIKSETEISKNKVKVVKILSILIAFVVAMGTGLYIFDEQQQTKEEQLKQDEYDSRIKPVYSNYLDETAPTSEGLQKYINQLDKLLKLEEIKYKENKYKLERIVIEIEAKKRAVAKAEEAAKAKKAKEEQNRTKTELTKEEEREIERLIRMELNKGGEEPRQAEPKKEEPKKEEPKAEPKKEEPKKEEVKEAEPKPAPAKKKASMSEDEAKRLYMEAKAMEDSDPEEAKKILQKIINSVDPSSKRYKKAKEMLDRI